MFNNIIASNGTAGLGSWVWSKSAEPSVLASHESDYNLWFQPDTPLVLLPQGSRPATLEGWRTEFRQHLHSLAADPKFADPARQDYRLLSTSPAIGRASPQYWLREDSPGNARPGDTALNLGVFQE